MTAMHRLVTHAISTLAALFDPGTIARWIAAGGPWVIFALLFACGLGLPLPEDIPLLAGGYISATGEANLVLVAVLAWCGIVGGDCVLYNLGRKYGLNITKVPFVGKHVTKERILKAEKLFDRWGVWVVAIGRLVAGVRGAMVVAAGATRFNFVKFLIADGLAALVSGGIFIAIGYWLGKKLGDFDQVVKKVKPYVEWFAGGVIFLVALFVFYKWLQHRKHKAMTDVALEKAVAISEKIPPRTSLASPTVEPTAGLK